MAAIGGKDAIQPGENAVYRELLFDDGERESEHNDDRGRRRVSRARRTSTARRSVQCFTDKGGWTINPMAGASNATPMPDDVYKAGKAQIRVGGALYDYAAQGAKAELLGKEGTAYKIKLTSKEKVESTYLIDSTSYLVTSVTSTGKMQDQDVTITTAVSDYRKTSLGMMVPYAMAIDVGGQFQLTIAVEKGGSEQDDSIRQSLPCRSRAFFRRRTVRYRTSLSGAGTWPAPATLPISNYFICLDLADELLSALMGKTAPQKGCPLPNGFADRFTDPEVDHERADPGFAFCNSPDGKAAGIRAGRHHYHGPGHRGECRDLQRAGRDPASASAYNHPEQLVKVWSRFTGSACPTTRNWVSAPEFRDLQQLNRSFSDLAAIEGGSFNLGVKGSPQRVVGAAVSPACSPCWGRSRSLDAPFWPRKRNRGGSM